MAKSLNGKHTGKTPKRRVNKARLAAVLAGLGLAGHLTISGIASIINSSNDSKEMIKTIYAIDQQMNEVERNLLAAVLEDNYLKVDKFLKYSSVVQEMDSSSPEYMEAINFYKENTNSFHDIYLETIKTKLAEMGGITNPNEIRNITIHRNVVIDGEAPRYSYDVENYPEIQLEDGEAREQFEKFSTLNLNTGKRNFTIEDENFKKQVDNVIKISELMGKDKLSELDYKQLAAITMDYYSMANDEINVSANKGFFDRLFSKSGDFEYKVVEDAEYIETPDEKTTSNSEVAKIDNDDIDV